MRADKTRNQDSVLAAAERLFDAADDPDTVSMDAIAAAAGVGKGTLFRGFGDRLGLVRALYVKRITEELDTLPTGRGLDPSDEAVELLTRMWRFKVRNRGLALALERAGRGSPYRNESYERFHAEITRLLVAAGVDPADFLAHALIAAVRADLVEHLRDQPDADTEAGLKALVHAVFAGRG
ncbi:helix-turn-helix domain-containing protein [Cryptosporangium japonicum]|uniref:TetR/AcrR family transcriptional regulator n=1 Tax=Cryptosporangium japonicum TaxID=80872 RepID=A0ABP3D468_9ACTN